MLRGAPARAEHLARVHQHANAPHSGLLRVRHNWPRSRRVGEQRDEVASFPLIELHSVPAARAGVQDIELAQISQRGITGILQPASRAEVRCGSKPVKLRTSRCFPLCSRKRTYEWHVRSTRCCGEQLVESLRLHPPGGLCGRSATLTFTIAPPEHIEM